MSPPKAVILIYTFMVINSFKDISDDSIIVGTSFKILTNFLIKVFTPKVTNVLINAMDKVNFCSTHYYILQS